MIGAYIHFLYQNLNPLSTNGNTCHHDQAPSRSLVHDVFNKLASRLQDHCPFAGLLHQAVEPVKLASELKLSKTHTSDALLLVYRIIKTIYRYIWRIAGNPNHRYIEGYAIYRLLVPLP